MLDPKGNTAVYLFYMYARICSVLRKANYTQKDIDELIKTEKIIITHEKERALLLSILKFNETIDETLSHLALNKLADYVYNVSVKFSEFLFFIAN
jgi:arginyl-tRNA synthetase